MIIIDTSLYSSYNNFDKEYFTKMICSCDPTGPTGPSGSNSNSVSCFCVNQMRNIIEQIIDLYPNDTLTIAMESGNNVSGRASSLFLHQILPKCRTFIIRK